MGIIAERLSAGDRVHLRVQRLTGLHRALGVIAAGVPPPGGALLIERCASVHGAFMRGPLDVAFLAPDGVVLRVARLAPWRVRWTRGARDVLELAPGECARLGIVSGQRVKKIFA